MFRWSAGVVVMVGVVLLGYGLARRMTPLELWDPVSFVIVAGGMLVYLLSAFGWGELRRSVALALSGRPASDEEWVRADHLFESAMRAVLVFGALGYVTALVIILKSLDDPHKLGPAMAVALLSILYALVGGELFFGTLRVRTQRYLRARQVSAGGAAPGPGTYLAALVLPTLPVLMALLVL